LLVEIATDSARDPYADVLTPPETDQADELRKAARSLAWNKQRLDRLQSLALAYRNDPSIKNYLAVRTEFPEIDIRINFSDLIEELIWARRKCEQHEIDASAINGYEPDIDKLCTLLMDRLLKREKLSGPGHLQQRRAAISDALVNYVIRLILEGI